MRKDARIFTENFLQVYRGINGKLHFTILNKPPYLFTEQNFPRVVYHLIVPKSIPRASSQVLFLLPQRPCNFSSINFFCLLIPFSLPCFLSWNLSNCFTPYASSTCSSLHLSTNLSNQTKIFPFINHMEFSISLLNFTNDLNATLYFEGYIILDYCKYPRFFQSGKHKQ